MNSISSSQEEKVRIKLNVIKTIITIRQILCLIVEINIIFKQIMKAYPKI